MQAAPTAAAAIHRCVASCERLFRASCARNESPVANDDIVAELPANRPVVPQEFVSPSSCASPSLCARSDEEDRLPVTTVSHEDRSIEDSLIDCSEIVEDLISKLLDRIPILPFLIKYKETFIKIAMIF